MGSRWPLKGFGIFLIGVNSGEHIGRSLGVHKLFFFFLLEGDRFGLQAAAPLVEYRMLLLDE